MAKIKGNKKNNKLKGKGQNDKIIGLAGDDLLNGKGGNDKLVAGSGNDLLDGGIGDDTLKGGAGDDQLLGGIGDDTLKAASGNDVLDGGDGDDTMDGGDGDDFFEAGDGNDLFVGGAGIDTVSYAKSTFGVSIELLLQTTTQGGLNDGFSGIENIDGSAFGDDIEGDNRRQPVRRRDRGDGAANKLRGLERRRLPQGRRRQRHARRRRRPRPDLVRHGADQLIGGNGVDSLVYEKANLGRDHQPCDRARRRLGGRRHVLGNSRSSSAPSSRIRSRAPTRRDVLRQARQRRPLRQRR